MSTSLHDRDQPLVDVRRWYSGYLRFRDVPDDTVRQLVAVAKGVPSFDVTSKFIELEYEGRDSSGIIRRTLLHMARLVGNADGEVECEVTGDRDQHWFEFYRIKDGRLFRQRGEIVRQSEQEVTESAL